MLFAAGCLCAATVVGLCGNVGALLPSLCTIHSFPLLLPSAPQPPSWQSLYAHPYPVGYKAYRTCWGMNFEMGILSEGGRPVFTVRSKDVRASPAASAHSPLSCFSFCRLRGMFLPVVPPPAYGALRVHMARFRWRWQVMMRGATPSDPWTALSLKYVPNPGARIHSANPCVVLRYAPRCALRPMLRCRHGPTKRTRVSGPRFFGFSDPATIALLRALPG